MQVVEIIQEYVTVKIQVQEKRPGSIFGTEAPCQLKTGTDAARLERSSRMSKEKQTLQLGRFCEKPSVTHLVDREQTQAAAQTPIPDVKAQRGPDQTWGRVTKYHSRDLVTRVASRHGDRLSTAVSVCCLTFPFAVGAACVRLSTVSRLSLCTGRSGRN